MVILVSFMFNVFTVMHTDVLLLCLFTVPLKSTSRTLQVMQLKVKVKHTLQLVTTHRVKLI